MAFEDYSTPRPEKWVSLGGKTREGKTNPTRLEGYFLCAITGPNKFDPAKTKTDYVLKTPQGIIGLSGTAYLARKFNECTSNFVAKNRRGVEGVLVAVEYTGTVDSGKGNPMKTYSVQFDAADTIDVDTVASAPQDDGDDFVADEDDDTVVAPEPIRPAAKAPSASSKAALQDILNKRKRA